MINLSIMPLDTEHVDEICRDVIEQQQSGVSTHAMFMMKFNPEGTPAVNKAEGQCKKYDLFRERLDRAGAKHGVLVQATMGHITKPYEPYPFQPSVSLITGEDRVVTACPLDPSFREYMKGQMKILASRHPSAVMIDDDVGLFYKPTKGCACKYHMAEFERRAGRKMSREELYAHTQGKSPEDIKWRDLYVEVQRDALVGFVKSMREGLDEVDPTIQGIVSGIYTSTFLEFSGEEARAFAGKGNPSIARMNGGPYGKDSHRYFTNNMFRAAILKENSKDLIDIYLAETDTCPQNRYSTSAALLHSHFTASILEGAEGAKHWITRLSAYEPNAGAAYRKKLAKYSKFYEALVTYAKRIEPFGCRIPLTLKQDYGFVESEASKNLSPWSTCVLETLGLPTYFGNGDGGAVFLDEFSVSGFDDEEIRKMLSGTLVITALAAKKLYDRGFSDYTGVTAREWDGAVITTETVFGKSVGKQYEAKEICVLRDGVEILSEVVHTDGKTGEKQILFPGVTRFDNSLGGEVITFSGTPDMPFKYFTAFSMLSETRKRQLVGILERRSHIPLYYPGDAEVYIRAGRVDGELFCGFFNKSFDELETVELVCKQKVTKVEKLSENGERVPREFSQNGDSLEVFENAKTHTPVILFIS